MSFLKSTPMDCALRGHDTSNSLTEENVEHSNASRRVSSESPLGSPVAVTSGLRGSPALSGEAAGAVGPNSPLGRLSSCSTVTTTEEQLKLNPVKAEVGLLKRRLWSRDLLTNPWFVCPFTALAGPAGGARGEPGGGDIGAGGGSAKSKAGRRKGEEGEAGSGEEAEGGEDEE